MLCSVVLCTILYCTALYVPRLRVVAAHESCRLALCQCSECQKERTEPYMLKDMPEMTGYTGMRGPVDGIIAQWEVGLRS